MILYRRWNKLATSQNWIEASITSLLIFPSTVLRQKGTFELVQTWMIFFCLGIMYCYGSFHKSVPRVLVPSRQRTLWKSSDIFRWSVHHNTLTDSRTPPPLGGPHYARSLALLNCRSRGPAPYIGPQTLSRTFLIIPENSGTLYSRLFLDRSRQHENSQEAARHFRNVPNCAVYRNHAITEWHNLNTLRIILRDAGET